MKYPVVILEDFFKNPDDIVSYANKILYNTPKPNDYWIGKRSESLSLINPQLFHFIVNKVISIFYNTKKEEVLISDIDIYFQKIKKTDIINCLETRKSMLHTDKSKSLSGIIYLSKKEGIKNGTKISLNENTDNILVSNKYNSMLCYDGGQLHSPIGSEDDDRLTIVFFIRKIQSDFSVYDRLNEIEEF